MAFDEHLVVRCRACRSGYVLAPRIEADRNPDAYSLEYESERRLDKAASCWRITVSRAGDRQPRSVLDLGCGTGSYLDIARRHGLGTAGVEVAWSAAEEARQRGHRVVHGSATQSLGHSERFDLVTAWDVLEHVDEPARLLETAFQAVNTGGMLLGVTPMMDSVFDRLAILLFRLSGRRFVSALRMCWSVEHRCRFAAAGLATVMREIGFEDVRVEPLLLLSLRAHQYAGSSVMPNWTGNQLLNRSISVLGVSIARLFRVNNKLLFVATRAS